MWGEGVFTGVRVYSQAARCIHRRPTCAAGLGDNTLLGMMDWQLGGWEGVGGQGGLERGRMYSQKM